MRGVIFVLFFTLFMQIYAQARNPIKTLQSETLSSSATKRQTLFKTMERREQLVKTCWSSSIAEKYRPDIQDLRDKLKNVYKDFNEKQSATHDLLRNMAIEVKSKNADRIKNLKKLISITTPDVASSLTKRSCDLIQNTELMKIYSQNMNIECLPNPDQVTELYNIKGNIIKLEKVTNALIVFCQYLNPLERENHHLSACISSKINHINVQMSVIQVEFKMKLTSIQNSVKKCIFEEAMSIEKKLNLVNANLYKCKVP